MIRVLENKIVCNPIKHYKNNKRETIKLYLKIYGKQILHSNDTQRKKQIVRLIHYISN